MNTGEEGIEFISRLLKSFRRNYLYLVVMNWNITAVKVRLSALFQYSIKSLSEKKIEFLRASSSKASRSVYC